MNPDLRKPIRDDLEEAMRNIEMGYGTRWQWAKHDYEDYYCRDVTSLFPVALAYLEDYKPKPFQAYKEWAGDFVMKTMGVENGEKCDATEMIVMIAKAMHKLQMVCRRRHHDRDRLLHLVPRQMS